MEIVCPSCNKANQSDPCQRCGCELGALFTLRQAADERLAAAAQCLRDSSPAEAGEAAAHAWALQHTVEAARLGFLAGLGSRDFEMAAYWLQRGFSVRWESHS